MISNHDDRYYKIFLKLFSGYSRETMMYESKISFLKNLKLRQIRNGYNHVIAHRYLWPDIRPSSSQATLLCYLLTYIGTQEIIYHLMFDLQVLLDLCIPAHICEVQGCHFFEDIFQWSRRSIKIGRLLSDRKRSQNLSSNFAQ